MPDPASRAIDRNFAGQPSSHQGYTLVPAAQARGWEWGAPNQGGVGAFVRLNPSEVRVTAPDGAVSTVPLPDVTAQAMRGMLTGAAAIAAVSCLLILLARLWGRR